MPHFVFRRLNLICILLVSVQESISSCRGVFSFYDISFFEITHPFSPQVKCIDVWILIWIEIYYSK